MADPEREFTWEGSAEIPEDMDTSTPEAICEAIFRLFNRVDSSDGPRLEAWGYRLPSLSSGDVIGIFWSEEHGHALYRVESVGFKRLYPGRAT